MKADIKQIKQIEMIHQKAARLYAQYVTKMENVVTAYFYDAMLEGDGELRDSDDWGESVTRFQPSEIEYKAFAYSGLEPPQAVDLIELADGYTYVLFN